MSHDGARTVEAVQKPFAPNRVGALTVPGALQLFSTPAPLEGVGHRGLPLQEPANFAVGVESFELVANIRRRADSCA